MFHKLDHEMVHRNFHGKIHVMLTRKEAHGLVTTVLAEVGQTWLVVEIQPEGPLELGGRCMVTKSFEWIGVEYDGICEGI